MSTKTPTEFSPEVEAALKHLETEGKVNPTMKAGPTNRQIRGLLKIALWSTGRDVSNLIAIGVALKEQDRKNFEHKQSKGAPAEQEAIPATA